MRRGSIGCDLSSAVAQLSFPVLALNPGRRTCLALTSSLMHQRLSSSTFVAFAEGLYWPQLHHRRILSTVDFVLHTCGMKVSSALLRVSWLAPIGCLLCLAARSAPTAQ